MPKGVKNANPVRLERLRARVAQSLAFLLTTNKNFDVLSNIIFERTGAMLSNSTLRRVFQYDCGNNPTKTTLDLICKTIGLTSWQEFVEHENTQSLSDLTQYITIIKLQGIHNHEQTLKIITDSLNDPNFYMLLEAIVQIAITSRDMQFLGQLFDIPGMFTKENEKAGDDQKIFNFIHNLVIGLNQSGLMPELIEYFGSNPKAQVFVVEWYVDEDNLNGYYHQLLQVYNRHKTTPEALLFYNCLMYQHAIENKLPKKTWADAIGGFDENIDVHYIPRARRFATILLEARENSEIVSDILQKTRDFYQQLNDDEKINAALYMVKLFFVARKHEVINIILSFTQDTNAIDKPINDRVNSNQLKIYRAYTLFKKGEKTNAMHKLNEFNPVFVNTFIHNHIMHDFQVISDLISNE